MKSYPLILASLMLSSSLSATELPSAPYEALTKVKHQGHQFRPPNPPRQVSPHQIEQSQRQLHHKVKTLSVQSLSKFNTNTSSRQSSAAEDACTSPDQLLGLNGKALVTAVINANLTSCLYGLYNASFVGGEHFADAKLETIINAINERLPAFDGSNATGAADIEKLVTYLRAMHWAESSANSNRVFTASYKAALMQAFDSYFNGKHFVEFNGDSSRNFMLRYEMLILVNSSNSDRLRYLPRFAEAISGYANSVDRADGWGVSYEENGMTQLLTHYFNAVNSQKDQFKQLLLDKPEIITHLRNFIATNGTWLIGNKREYQWADATSELGRLLQFKGTIADSVRPTIKAILSNYEFEGTGSKGWVNAQNMVLNYDSENCSIYGDACDFNLEEAVLAGRHTCSDTLKVRFQQPISEQNLINICENLSAEEDYFHSLFKQPASVKNDSNTDLEVVIFKSSSEYQNYAGSFFNISTDNGGMYLEGTPNDTNNQARFIAYQATWLPEFTVWNLEHEYIHYLDGRFNQWGGFSDQPANLVWWGEGVAEYLSQKDTNEKALGVAPDKTYSFSDLLQTTYNNGDTARVYYWGYLAVRFMFERHQDQVFDRLLPTMRAAKYSISDAPCQFDWSWRSKQEATENNWAWLYDDSENASGNWVWTCGQEKTAVEPLPEFEPYADIVTGWTGQYDAEFNEWLDCLISGEDCSGNQNTVLQNGQSVSVAGLKASEQHFSINLPDNAYDLRIETKGGTGDVDLYVRQMAEASLSEWDYRPYWIGNREHVEILQPKSEIDVMLHGYRDFKEVTLTATWKEGTLSQLQQWAELSGQRRIYKWVYVPENAKSLYFTLGGGKGDAQLYVKQKGWPANNNYDAASSITRGTSQKIKMDKIKPGNYYHILIETLEGFEDVSLDVFMVE